MRECQRPFPVKVPLMSAPLLAYTALPRVVGPSTYTGVSLVDMADTVRLSPEVLELLQARVRIESHAVASWCEYLQHANHLPG